MQAIRRCHNRGIKVGMRFTLTQDNAGELSELLDLMDAEGVEKFYLSHLNYAGRGNRNRKDDVVHQTTRRALDLLFDTSWRDVQAGRKREFVTGNNDADGVYLLFWTLKNMPERAKYLQTRLEQWGGNSSGVNVANIDNLGNVHPDTMWWDYNLGNVRDRPFSTIWQDISDPVMAGLKVYPRPVGGRCGECRYLNICGGNTRVRSYQLTGDLWAEDPACYLDDEEIGASGGGERLQVTPFRS
ncbi:MAG: SPASM domain-containing protein, partial [Gammaproteobacteria bacterium]|nr:SPASM domain-containing protein [Gammaproteobacteria bacterium]